MPGSHPAPLGESFRPRAGVHIPRCASLTWDMSSKRDHRSMALGVAVGLKVTEARAEGNDAVKASGSEPPPPVMSQWAAGLRTQAESRGLLLWPLCF